MAQGLINNGVSVTKDFSPNEYELLADYTVSGSAITSVTFGTLLEPLRINADEEVVLVSDFINAIGSATDISLYANGNTTNTNYYMQFIYVDGTTISGGRQNTSNLVWAGASGGKGFAITTIKLTNNGYFIYQSKDIRAYSSTTPIIFDVYNTSTFTTSQITSLTLIAQNASAIGIGSRFQLYKVKGQVQQTWATT